MTINLITQEFYIGKHATSDLNDRYLGSGLKLKNSVKKYGAENFKREIIEFYQCEESAYLAEAELVSMHLNHPKCLNLVDGGKGFTAESAKRASNFAKLLGREGYKFKTRDGKRRSSIASALANKSKGTGIWGMSIEQRSKWNKDSALGRVWITNGEADKHIKADQPLSPGWFYGRSVSGSQYRTGMQCWNNGKINVFNFDCPGSDFKAGMIKDTPTSKMPWWNNGIKNKRSFNQPDGFVAGRLKWTSKTVTCPFCNKQGGETAMKRHHFENCKRRSNG